MVHRGIPRLSRSIKHSDDRGSVCKFPPAASLWGPGVAFMDSYVSSSRGGVFRGLHCQRGSDAQAKAFLVLAGHVHVFAVCVDHFLNGQLHSVRFALDANDGNIAVIPEGWATGLLSVNGASKVWSVASAALAPEAEMVIDAICLKEVLDVSMCIRSPKDTWGRGKKDYWMTSEMAG